MKMIQVSEDALNTLKAMAEQDAKDAARYRWLRDYAYVDHILKDLSNDLLPAGEEFSTLDAAIDAAMQTK